MEIEVPSDEFNAFYDKAILKLGQDMEFEGFRRGKAPKDIVESKIGKEKIMFEAADLAVKDNYVKAVQESKIEPISKPEIEITKIAQGNPLVFKAKVAVLPEIKLPDYKKIAGSVKKNKVSVDEKEIEESLEWLRKSRAKTSLKNEPAGKGDFVEITYSSDLIEELKESKKDAFILGEGNLVKGFEENLIGISAGEEKKFSVKLVGKETEFKVKMESVQKVELPEITDEFAKSLGNFSNVLNLKENIKSGITAEKEKEESQRVRNEIVLKISEQMEMEIPDILVEREKDNLRHNFEHELEHHLKIPLKDYLEKTGKTEKDITDMFEAEAKKKIKAFLALKEIGARENIPVPEDEVKAEAEKALAHYKAEGADIDIERLKEYTKEAIMNEKILDMLEKLANKL